MFQISSVLVKSILSPEYWIDGIEFYFFLTNKIRELIKDYWIFLEGYSRKRSGHMEI